MKMYFCLCFVQSKGEGRGAIQLVVVVGANVSGSRV